MRWQRVARLGFAVVGVACAVALAIKFHTRPAPVAPPAPPKHDPAATVEGGHGTSLEWGKDGKVSWRIEFGSMASYPDGKKVFTQAHFMSAHANRQFEIQTDWASTEGKSTRGAGPADLDLKGHVHITTSDHWVIQTETATYADATGIVTIPGPLTFVRDRLTGQGQGATYDRGNDVLTIRDQARVVEAPDASGAGALDASASHMVLARTQKSAQLDGDTRVERDKETLLADSQSVLFTDDEKGLKQLDMHGHAKVTPKPGVTDGPPDMRADNITLWLYPDGRTLQHATLRGQANVLLTSTTGTKTIAAPAVDLELANDGQTLTRLDSAGGVTVHLPPTADTPSARTIVAPSLASTGDAHGLTAALFSGDVTFQEHTPASGATPASDRSAHSKSLALKLNGDLGAVDEAEFRQVVHFIDGDVTADSDHATYNEPKNLLILDAPGSKTQPEVVNGTVTVFGDLIHLATDTHDVDATGHVQTKTLPTPPANGAKPTSPGLFDSTQPSFGASAHLHYESGPQRGTYQGTDAELARVWQTADQNDVRADTIVVEQATNNLHATGHVASTFATDPKPAPASSGGRGTGAPPVQDIYHAKAQELVYTDSTRLAHYVGGSEQTELKGPNGTTTAHMIDVVLAQESRTVDRMVADGEVHLVSDQYREGKGDHLIYEAAQDQYHLTGVPGLAVLPQSKTDGSTQPKCTLYRAKTLIFAGGGFAAASSGGDHVDSFDWQCGQPIK